jgi:hypothetical protein
MVCDVPGLIKGAYRTSASARLPAPHPALQGAGVLLDMAGTDGRAPWDDYRSVELTGALRPEREKAPPDRREQMDEAPRKNLKRWQKIRRLRAADLPAVPDCDRSSNRPSGDAVAAEGTIDAKAQRLTRSLFAPCG